jgi:hypothetical protein
LIHRQVFLFTLSIRKEHKNGIWGTPKVDDSQCPPLSGTWDTPTDPPQTSATSNHPSRIGAQHQNRLEHPITFIRKQTLNFFGEKGVSMKIILELYAIGVVCQEEFR